MSDEDDATYDLSPEDEQMIADDQAEDAKRALCRDCGNRAHLNAGGHCPSCAKKWAPRQRHMVASIGMFAVLAMLATPSSEDPGE